MDSQVQGEQSSKAVRLGALLSPERVLILKGRRGKDEVLNLLIDTLAKVPGIGGRDELAFGLDYARTLGEWLLRFNAQRDAVRAQGFDERFVRMWQFYLAYCEAGFRAGSTDVYQFVLSHEARS